MSHQNQNPLLEVDEFGETRGRDPKQVSAAEYAQVGIAPRSKLMAIRDKCIDCSGNSTKAARECASTSCALWPYRMGKDPFSKRKVSPAAVEALRAYRQAREK